MKNLVKFYELDGEQKLSAISQIFQLSRKHNYCGSEEWDSADCVAKDIDDGFCANEYFTFEVDENSDSVKVCTNKHNGEDVDDLLKDRNRRSMRP